MVQFYVVQIRLGRLHIENVPALWREKVKKALDMEEGGRES